jgi:DNA-binding response OmpR family regulator
VRAVKVLIVEDTEKLGLAIRDALNRAQFVCDVASSVEEADALLATSTFDLILLDLSLPDGDGLDFLRQLRARKSRTPVIVLTARGGLNDRISGLDDGADDYLVKPIAMSELISRCRAMLRRPDLQEQTPIKLGRVMYDPVSGLATATGHAASLPRRESFLLGTLMRRAGKVCTRQFLEESIYESAAEVTPNALEASIYRLRAFLTNAAADVEVRTVRGIGYVLIEAEPAPAPTAVNE